MASSLSLLRTHSFARQLSVAPVGTAGRGERHSPNRRVSSGRGCCTLCDGDGQCAVSITPRERKYRRGENSHVFEVHERADGSRSADGAAWLWILRRGPASGLCAPAAQDL